MLGLVVGVVLTFAVAALVERVLPAFVIPLRPVDIALGIRPYRSTGRRNDTWSSAQLRGCINEDIMYKGGGPEAVASTWAGPGV